MSFLTYPNTDQQKKLLALAGGLADIFAKRAARDEWEGRFPLANYEDLRQSGYLSLTVPRDLGGWGAPLADVVLAQQRLAQGCASTALVVSMHLSVITTLEAGLGSDDALFARICQSVVQEGALINGALTEPGGGSFSRGGRFSTVARRQQDGSWRIDGRKSYTSGSYALNFFVIGAALEDEASDHHLAPLEADQGFFLVPAWAPGLHIEDTWHTLSMRGTASNDAVLDDVHVEPSAYMNGHIFANTSSWTLLTAAVYLGIAQAARDEAVQFARTHHPNSLDRPIASVPHVQEKVAKMDLALLQSRAVLFAIAEELDRNPSHVPASSAAAAKYLVTNHAVEVVDLAMRLVGGASLSLHSVLQRHYRDVRAGLHNSPMDDTTLALLSKDAFAE